MSTCERRGIRKKYGLGLWVSPRELQGGVVEGAEMGHYTLLWEKTLQYTCVHVCIWEDGSEESEKQTRPAFILQL